MLSQLCIPKVPILALTTLWHPAYSSYMLNYVFMSVNSLLLPLGPCMLASQFWSAPWKGILQSSHPHLLCFGLCYGETTQTGLISDEPKPEYLFQGFTLCTSAANGLFIHGLLPRAEAKPLQCVGVNLGFPAPFCSTYLCPFELCYLLIQTYPFPSKIVTKKKHIRARRTVGCHGIYFTQIVVGILEDFFLPLGEKKEFRYFSSFLDKELGYCMIYWHTGPEGDVVAVPIITAAICGPQ